MTKPTKEEVEDYIYDSEGETDSEGNDTFYRRLAKACLSQEEELMSKDKTIKMLASEVGKLELERRDLEAENQALKAKLDATTKAVLGRVMAQMRGDQP